MQDFEDYLKQKKDVPVSKKPALAIEIDENEDFEQVNNQA
jgi:hypothetical protein